LPTTCFSLHSPPIPYIYSPTGHIHLLAALSIAFTTPHSSSLISCSPATMYKLTYSSLQTCCGTVHIFLTWCCLLWCTSCDPSRLAGGGG
jgi:hypothetical protein